MRRGQPSSERRRFLLLDGGALLAGWAAGERGDTVSNTHTPYSCYKYHGPTTAVLRILLDLPVHMHTVSTYLLLVGLTMRMECTVDPYVGCVRLNPYMARILRYSSS